MMGELSASFAREVVYGYAHLQRIIRDAELGTPIPNEPCRFKLVDNIPHRALQYFAVANITHHRARSYRNKRVLRKPCKHSVAVVSFTTSLRNRIAQLLLKPISAGTVAEVVVELHRARKIPANAVVQSDDAVELL